MVFLIARNRLHGYQSNSSHITTKKTKSCNKHIAVDKCERTLTQRRKDDVQMVTLSSLVNFSYSGHLSVRSYKKWRAFDFFCIYAWKCWVEGETLSKLCYLPMQLMNSCIVIIEKSSGSSHNRYIYINAQMSFSLGGRIH